jgi:putative ABC transport system ATP-binding protein
MTDTATTMTDVPAAQASPIYRLEGITRTYAQKDRTVHALAGIDLEIHAGEFVSIQGPTGGG